MAFLDNSGDIILDAVLTDLGREKMAEGTFSVSYFALGDDEIDYALYNKNHPSGSAYYDLEILQTPVFEAFTQTNSSINYGLLETTATNLLYMPILVLNELDPVPGISQRPSNTAGSIGLVWVTDDQNDTTTTQIKAVLINDTNDFDNNYLPGKSTGKFLLIEAGLNTDSIKGTSANRTSYIVSPGLVDKFYYVYYDSRFINTVYGSASGDTFSQQSDGSAQVVYTPTAASSTSLQVGLENYSTARIMAAADNVVYSTDQTVSDTSISAIEGPRGSCAFLNVNIVPTLDTEYTLYGTLGSTSVLPGATSVDYIDTTVYVQGGTTGQMIQIPLRIVRLAS